MADFRIIYETVDRDDYDYTPSKRGITLKSALLADVKSITLSEGKIIIDRGPTTEIDVLYTCIDAFIRIEMA